MSEFIRRQERLDEAIQNPKTLAHYIHFGCGPTISFTDAQENLNRYHKNKVVEIWNCIAMDLESEHIFRPELQTLNQKHADAMRFILGESITNTEMLEPR